MNQNDVALLHLVGLAQQVLRSEALHHHRRGRRERDRFWQLDEMLGLDVALFGVRAEGRDIGDPVAGTEALDALADRHDLARALVARRERIRRRRIEPGAVIDVEVIDGDRAMANPDFAGTRRRQFDVLEAHDVRGADVMDSVSRAWPRPPRRTRAP